MKYMEVKRLHIFAKLKAGSLIFSRHLKRDKMLEKLNLIGASSNKNVTLFNSQYSKEILPDKSVHCIKFVSPTKKIDYLLYSTDSDTSFPKKVAIGTMVDGKVHLISERYPHNQESIYLFTIKNSESFEKEDKEKDEPDKKYISSFFTPPDDVTNEDIKCINAALAARRRIARALRKIKKK